MISLTGQGLIKRYGATRALDGLDLDIASGEIVGIAGPNGAGKSTLIRMLAGEESPDQGEIRLTRAGEHAADVWRHVAVVHQEPHVWPNLTVRENLAVGREVHWFGKPAPEPGAEAVLDRLGIGRFADFQLADLSLAVQQRVEIVRAIISHADVFLFDEPNSALTEEESQALFATMAELAADSKIVLLITHRLNDFVRFCGRVLVPRDGRISTEVSRQNLTEAAIAAELTKGFAAGPDAHAPAAASVAADPAAAPILRLTDCSDVNGGFRGVSLDLVPGRVLALTGVEGSGARELAQAIGGFRPLRQEGGTPRRAASYLAASRRQTVFHNLSVAENLAARLGWRQLSRPWPLLDPGAIDRLAAAGVPRYRIKTAAGRSPITSLSGGNQQKVVLGAVIEENNDILVVEEPTRGVDISSKVDIYGVLREFARSGRAVVIFCTEVQEIFEAADDVVVLSRGRIVRRIEVASVLSITALAGIVGSAEQA